ncbi:MAG: exodeoxyribonuclease III [bacterium]|nr:exodeoxyribonuclease III [bacterium]
MKLFSWNVNGIRAVIRKEELQKFVKKYDPDILCIQETKAQQGQAEIDLPQYGEYWNSAEKKGYSGTAIFTKHKPIEVHFGIPDDIAKKHKLGADKYGDPTKEGRILAAEFDDYFVVTAYTPNAKDDLSRIPMRHKHWDPAVLDYIKQLEMKKPVLYCGDMNVAHTADDLARPEQNDGKKGFTKQEREGFQNWIDAGFVDTFRKFTPKGNGYYTYWSNWGGARPRNVGWRIDYWLVSKSMSGKLKKAEIHADQMGSDHCPVSIEV